MKKYDNYVSNLNTLSKAEFEDLDNEFIMSGVIDKFFIQFELGWKVLKELLKYEGNRNAKTGSPRQIIKSAYSIYEFMDEEIWLNMLKDRNDMTHIYDLTAAKRLVDKIIQIYIPEFERMKVEIESLYGSILEEL